MSKMDIITTDSNFERECLRSEQNKASGFKRFLHENEATQTQAGKGGFTIKTKRI